jgi:two-component system nitrate/nitrite response regulator NarL
MSAAPWRVLLVDDHSVVRAGIKHLLDADPSVQVVGEAATAAEAVTQAAALAPQLVILDISMPGATGLAVVGRLREVSGGAHVVVLSMHSDAEYVREAERVGAAGYVLKDDAAVELVEAIATVRRGERFRSAKLGRRGAQRAPSDDPLTPREREVLRGIASGLTNKEVAAELGISHRTVETHRENVMRKLGITTVPGLTRYAIDHGLTGG